ncbi:MAG: MCE family protein [Euzebya sp.]
MTDRIPGVKFILFTLICFAAATYIISVTGNLDRLPFIDGVNNYEAVLEEAGGLAVGDDVRIAGVDIGRVNGISLYQGNAVVEFEVAEDVVPTTTWQAGARWRNAIGQRFLYLYPNPGGQSLVSDQLGEDAAGRIPVDRSVEVADLAQFVATLDPLLAAIDPASQNKLTNALNDVLVGRDETIQTLVSNISELAGTVSDEEPEIRAVIANANLLLGEYNSREDQLTNLIDNLASVSRTLANRSGEVLDSAVDLADVQAQLADLIATNDQGLVNSVDNLRRITDSIGSQRGAFEDSIASLRQGLASYMIISRRGQWFNVRGVAVQVQEGGQIVTCTTETGTNCAFPNSSIGAGGQQPPGQNPDEQGTEAPGQGDPDTTPPEIPSPVLTLAPQRFNALEVVTALPLIAAQDAAAAGGDR